MTTFIFTTHPPVTEQEIETAIYYGMVPKDATREEVVKRIQRMKQSNRQVKPTIPADYYDEDPRREEILKHMLKSTK